MPLTIEAKDIDEKNPGAGMAKAIYAKLIPLEKDLENLGLSEKEIKPIKEGWQKLADAIAKGVVEYISQHMTISGIKTEGVVAGQTAADDPVGHQHTINLKIEGPTAFVQSNDGTGHVGWVDDDKDHA